MAAAQIQTWFKPLKTVFQQDPRRAWLVAGVSLVMVGLSVHLLSRGPAAATAAAGHTEVVTSRNRASAGAVQMAVAQRPAPREELVEWLNADRLPPRRDIFAGDAPITSSAGITTVTDSQTVEKSEEEGGVWDELAKSLASRADHRWERQARIANLKREASRLRLSKIVIGPPPAALLNDELVEEGSVVASFRVLKIEPRRIVVEREGIRLDVPLN